MPTEVAKRGPGRPSKNKRGTFKFRVTDGLRTQMEAAARVSNRSVSEEIEHRLEQSLASDFLLTQLMGSGKNASLLKLIAIMLSGLDQRADPWYSNPASAESLRSDIERAMSAVANSKTLEEAVAGLHPSSSALKLGTLGMLEIPAVDETARASKSRRNRNTK